MQDKKEVVKKMETQLEEIDAEMAKTFKKLEKAHLDSEIQLPLRKKMEALVDSRKDLSDRVHELKCAADNSWDIIEKHTIDMLKSLTQSVRQLSEEQSYKD